MTITGDVDGDKASDRVSLLADKKRPQRCQYSIAVERSGGVATRAAIEPLKWAPIDPRLLLLAEINGLPGLESVISLTPGAVYRPGVVFTMEDGKLRQLRLPGSRHSTLFPFYDEFPAGVDCADEPGTIVVTIGKFGDSYWDITRTFYQTAGIRFEALRKESHIVDNPVPRRLWPEVRDRPFRSCPEYVDR